jgi:hypothetical protein
VIYSAAATQQNKSHIIKIRYISMNRPFTISAYMSSVSAALGRARYSIYSVAGVYGLSVLVGILMVHAGSTFALNARNQLVNSAQQESPRLAANQGDNLKAALLDFAGNLVIGAVPKTVSGLGIIFPYPLVAYQGWVGGIVSAGGNGASRFDDPRSAFYYLLTIVLQLIPYSLATGAGVNAGISMFRPQPYYQGQKWLSIFPKEALLDILRIYSWVVPIFLVASLWEFLSPWNFF